MKRPKVLHLATGLDVGGAETSLKNVVLGMSKRGWDVEVVSLIDVGPVGREIISAGVPVHSLGMRRGSPSPLGFPRLIVLLRRIAPDVLQTWLYHADLLGLLAGKLTRVPIIVWNLRTADLDRADHPRSLFWVLAALARFSRVPKAVIVNSSTGKLAHERLGYRPARWELIPNGFDSDAFFPSEAARAALRRSLRLDDSAPLIGLVARFHPMKDHGTFLRAAAIVCREHPDVHLVMAGEGIDGGNALLARTVEELELGHRVHLLGRRSDVAALLAGLDVVVSSSYGEGFPNIVGEAMACAVACVVTDAGDSAELVGDTGLVVPVRDPKALADALLRVLAMPEGERRAIGLEGRARIRSLYSVESMTRRYEELYEELAVAL